MAIDVGALEPVARGPVRLTVDDDSVDSRGDPNVSRALRHPEADDVVLVNQRGEITETTTANLAVQLDGCWWTPPAVSGCLPGVERHAFSTRVGCASAG